MSKIQDDSYWYVEKVEPYEDSKIRAMCTSCAQRVKSKESMCWPGEKGYGDYDLNCSLCGKIIYQREIVKEELPS